MLDNTTHRIKIYLVDNAIGFPDTYLLDSDCYRVDSAIQRLNNQGLVNNESEEHKNK